MRNLIVTGGIFHPFEETSQALAGLLGSVGISSQITTDLEDGMRALATGQFELLTVYALRWTMTQKDKYEPYRKQWAYRSSKALSDTLTGFVSGGGALLGLHTASICFDDWPQWRDVLGGQWDWDQSFHPPLAPVSILPTDHFHPIVADVQPFEINDEVYHHLSPMPDVKPLLSSDVGSGPQPVLWARQFGEGKVVYDALGHDAESITHPVHAGILQRAAQWLTNGSMPATKGAD